MATIVGGNALENRPGVLHRLWTDLAELCRADSRRLAHWLDEDRAKLLSCLFWLVIGSGIYGASIGLWRSPLQSLFVGIKFPLLILLTTIGNGAVNGMLAQLLGARITFRQSFLAVVMSFALAAVVLGSLTPLSFFLYANLPPMGSASAGAAYATVLVVNVFAIAFAGILANVRLLSLLTHICGSRIRALQILFAWLAGNMFLGCQLSWNLRPFLGSPQLPVAFLRDDPFNGSFYESLFHHIMTLISG